MQRLKVSTAGESHGPAELCILEGIPAGLELSAEDIDRELARRQRGYGRGARMTIEQDRVTILGGVRLGVTLGSPIALLVENKDHLAWCPAMQPERGHRPEHDRITVPRPGHADLAGLAKFGHEDVRDVLERASARETVSRVAAGAVAKLLLGRLGITVRGRVVRLGNVSAPEVDLANPAAIDWAAVEESVFGCDDPEIAERMQEAVDDARALGESLGGVFEIWAWNVCPGLGNYSRAGDRLDGRLIGALGSIPAVKGVEIGQGFASAGLLGSEVHDPIVLELDPPERRWVTRITNRAGGLEGGVTNGMPLVLRAAMKPIPTLSRPLPSVDLATMEPTTAHRERSDVEAVAAARVVGEAVVALELADAALEKFGGDSVREFLTSFDRYVSLLEDRGLWRR